MKSTEVAIDELVSQIIRLAHPLKVILFGSAARGNMNPDSDIDVLVIVSDGTHRRRTAQRLYREIHNIGIPFDVVVANPADIERHKDNVGLIYRSILREGKEVYVA